MNRRPKLGKSIKQVLALVWNVEPRGLVIYLAASAVSGGMIGVALILLREIIAGTLNGTIKLSYAIALAVLLVIQEACSSIAEKQTIVLRQKISARVNLDIQSALPAVPYSSFEDTAFQAEYGMLVREASFKPATLVDSILQGSLAFFTIVAIVVVLFPLMPAVALILLVLFVPVALAERSLRGRTLKLQTYHAPDLLRMQYISQSSVDPDWQRDLRACGSDVLRREYAELSGRYLRSLSSVISRIQRIRFLAAVGSLAVFGLMFALIIEAVTRHKISAADALTLATGGYYLAMRIGAISTNIGSVIESSDFMARVFGFLDTYAPTDAPAEIAQEPPAVPGRIVLTSVCYRYPRAQAPALSDADITIEPGITAIIGANGAGKSTLVKMLAGLITPASGELLVTDRSGQPVPLGALRSAVMFQHPAHLRLTVRQNVTMAAATGPDTDASVWKVLEEVDLAGVIRALPDGLDSVLGGGFGAAANLSGGQWQRLALARVLYRDAQLVILDEPSSHLDAKAEARLLTLLTEGFRDRIVVVVTHRRETLQICDRYFEFADGRLAASGAIADLGRVSQPYLSSISEGG